MRPFGPALVLLLLVCSTFGQQLQDPDFELTITPPPGMALVEHDVAAGVFGQDPATFNRPRSESTEGSLNHNFLWDDQTGRDRQMRLLVEETPLGQPFTKGDAFKQFAETQIGLTVENQQALSASQGYLVGMLVEGTRQRPDGSKVNGMLAFFPNPPNTYAQIYFQALTTDWEVMKPDFMASLKSLRMPQQLQRAERPVRTMGVDELPTDYVETWDSLEVAGSLALAVVLLMSLFFSGRAGA